MDDGFIRSAMQAATWRMFLLLQALGLAFALIAWCRQVEHNTLPHLAVGLLFTRQATALAVMAAMLLADEAVRRARALWKVFLVAVALATLASTAFEYVSRALLGYMDQQLPGLFNYAMYNLLVFGGTWALVILVYLDRQSAARRMAGVRTAELDRLQLEKRLMDSREAAAGARLDPGKVVADLARIRDLFDGDRPGAEARLEALIADLENSVRRGSIAASGAGGP